MTKSISWRQSLRTRLATIMVLASLVPMIILAGLAYYRAQDILRDDFRSRLDALIHLKEDAVLTDVTIRNEEVMVLGRNPTLVAAMSGDDPIAVQRTIDNMRTRIATGSFSQFDATDRNGRVVLSTSLERVGQSLATDVVVQNGLQKVTVGDITVDDEGNLIRRISAPIVDTRTGVTLGVLVATNVGRLLREILESHDGIGQTGETYLIGGDNRPITRLRGSMASGRTMNSPVVQHARRNGEENASLETYTNYAGQEVIGATAYRKMREKLGVDWLLVAEVETEEALAPAIAMRNALMIVSALLALGALLAAVVMARKVAQPVVTLATAAERIRTGDLRIEHEPMGTADEIGLLDRSFNSMALGLREMVQKLNGEVSNIISAATQVSASTQQQSASAAEQSAAVTETATTMEQLKQTARQVGQKAKQVLDVSQRALTVATEGQSAVERAMTGVGDIKAQVNSIAERILTLSERTQEIGQIIGSVNDIAEQSRILAFNASIEASKAGEYGRGFAVVAGEIRALAEQSKSATTQVSTILNDIQKATTATVMVTEQGTKAADIGVGLAETASSKIRHLAEAIEEASQATMQIEAAIQQQNIGLDQVDLAVRDIQQGTSQMVIGAQQNERSASALHDLGQRLRETVAQYRI